MSCLVAYYVDKQFDEIIQSIIIWGFDKNVNDLIWFLLAIEPFYFGVGEGSDGAGGGGDVGDGAGGGGDLGGKEGGGGNLGGREGGDEGDWAGGGEGNWAGGGDDFGLLFCSTSIIFIFWMLDVMLCMSGWKL